MNHLKWLGLILVAGSHALGMDFVTPRRCSLTRYWSAPYFHAESPQKDSVAHVRTGKNEYRLAALQDLIEDRMIHFRNDAGEFTREYLWLYSPFTHVPGTGSPGPWKFYSGGMSGDTILSLEEREGRIAIQYASTSIGPMLDLICEAPE